MESFILGVMIFMSVGVLMFGLVLAVDMNKLINAEMYGKKEGNASFTRLKIKGEK